MIRVSADHKDPRWQLDGAEFAVVAKGEYGSLRVGGDAANGFYAIAPNFGCGKSRTTPTAAIRHLLEDNGCVRIRFED